MHGRFTYNRVALLVSALLTSWTAVAGNSDASEPEASNSDIEVIEIYGDMERRDGFRPRTADMGPLGTRSLLDTPYSISVFNNELIESVGATSLNDILKYMSSSQMEARGGTDVGRPQSRGMEGSVVQNNHMDGLNVAATTAQPIELFDRIEVINGLTGAIYGPASPAGMFNYIMKRPTSDYYTSLNTGVTDGGAVTLHVDTAGSPNEYFGYRVNLLNEEGTGYVKGSNIDRQLGGIALDIRPFEHTVIELNGSYYQFEKFGYPGGFSYSDDVALPDAPDSNEQGYGQEFAGTELNSKTFSARVKQEINDNWSFSVGYLEQDVERTFASVSHKLTGEGTMISSVTVAGTTNKYEITSNSAHLNGQFNTGDIRHDVVFGTTGYSWDIFTGTRRQTQVLGTSDVYDPQVYARPDIQMGNPYTLSSTTKAQSGFIGDTITWNEKFSTMLVGSYSEFEVDKYGASGGYNDDGLSSTISMIYKPVRSVSIYAAYADTLESGGTASDTAVNANESLPPVRSEQYELGYKSNLGKFDINAAIFQLERAIAYEGSDGIYKDQGLQRNTGAELSVNGNITDALKIFSGVTYLNSELKEAYDESTTGKKVVGIPDWQGNFLATYAVGAVPGLSVTANLHYTGKRAANSTNTTWADGYTTLDLGATYRTEKFFNKALTVRLHVTNVTNTKYWSAIFPGNISGTPGSNNSAFLGEPMQAFISASVKI
ncbi:TonB-dependent receptor [Shewanella youngdeokensis]|uniref:TonB-dependent siderophore receptor n=1 Tax=Shewanella youngdeokensis TaxID=2999068 RepID=A0ABZ0K2B7_9GAMM|nr:TonB-dependent siderophore receptor [Shewanella sp. DAU334]